MKQNGSKKKGGKKGGKKYYLVKVPKFIAQSWWDPQKYPPHSNLGTLQYMGAKKMKGGQTEKAHMKLTVNVNDPHYPGKPRMNATPNGGMVEAPLKIPSELNVSEKKSRTVSRFKHDRYQDKEEVKLLVFSEKTLPALNKPLQVKTRNGDLENATVLNIYEQGGKQLCEVKYDDGAAAGGQKHESVTERDVEIERVEWNRKCKLIRYVDRHLEATPVMGAEYRKFLKNRFRAETTRSNVQIQSRESIFDINDSTVAGKKRRRDLVERKLEIERKKQRIINEGPKLKRVRRDADIYRKKIFAAFDKQPYLTREDLCGWCGDSSGSAPWAFIKETVASLCQYHNVGEHQKTFSLKDDYKLDTDHQTS